MTGGIERPQGEVGPFAAGDVHEAEEPASGGGHSHVPVVPSRGLLRLGRALLGGSVVLAVLPVFPLVFVFVFVFAVVAILS